MEDAEENLDEVVKRQTQLPMRERLRSTKSLSSTMLVN
jgi:hypothetical protein